MNVTPGKPIEQATLKFVEVPEHYNDRVWVYMHERVNESFWLNGSNFNKRCMYVGSMWDHVRGEGTSIIDKFFYRVTIPHWVKLSTYMYDADNTYRLNQLSGNDSVWLDADTLLHVSQPQTSQVLAFMYASVSLKNYRDVKRYVMRDNEFFLTLFFVNPKYLAVCERESTKDAFEKIVKTPELLEQVVHKSRLDLTEFFLYMCTRKLVPKTEAKWLMDLLAKQPTLIRFILEPTVDMYRRAKDAGGSDVSRYIPTNVKLYYNDSG